MPLFTDHYTPSRPSSMREMLRNLELARKKAFEVTIAKKVNSASKLCTAVQYMYMLFHIFYIHPLRYMYMYDIPNKREIIGAAVNV